MRTIYLLVSCVGDYEDYREHVEKAFGNKDVAELFKHELEETENSERAMADKCRECAGLNKDCPFFLEPFDGMDECDNYNPYHDNITYKIVEVPYEE